MSLAYGPTTTDSGTVSLGYQYNSDAGNAKSGTVNISYAATSPHLYIANLFSVLDECTLGSNGSLSSCAATPASGGSGAPAGIAFNGATAPWALAINGNYLYVTSDSTLSGGHAYIGNQQSSTVAVCSIGSGGALTGCANSAVGIEPNGVAILGNDAYVTDDDNIYKCTVGAGGSLGSCAASNGGATFSAPQQVVIH